MQKWQCRIAPSLGGGFAGTPESAWGTVAYESDLEPTVFFGLYGLNDFYALWRHKGDRAVLWAGSDIKHFVNGYWLDSEGNYRVDVPGMANWLNNHAEHYVENIKEYMELRKVGIEAKVVPSFLGDIDDYELQEPPEKQMYYTTVSSDNFELYGWTELETWAAKHPEVEFHCYGASADWLRAPNIISHGRVSQEQMNEETKKMTGAIRLTKFDGFSEILAKSVLWGQWPVSPYIPYPFIDSTIIPHVHPNYDGRDYYRQTVNQYPWNVKNN